MLVSGSDQFSREGFTNEAEIEGAVQQYAELLFGTDIIYLPQIRTGETQNKRTNIWVS